MDGAMMVRHGMNRVGILSGFSSVDGWSGDRSWFDDDWSYWPED